jgi:rod shape-determining protein MreD
MSRAGLFILVAVAALVQVTWAARLEVHGAFPNLVLGAVVCIAWMRGERAGLMWACIGGLLLDLTAPGPLGPHALALVVGAYAVGFWVRNVKRSSIVQPALAAVAASVIYSAVLVGADDLLGLPVPPLWLVLNLGAAACVYNAVLVAAALLLLRRIAGRSMVAA